MSSNISLQPDESLYNHQDSTNRCVLCDDPRYETERRVEKYGFAFTFSRCQCGLVKQTPMPNQQFFEWFFNSDLFISSKKSGAEEIWGFYDYFKDEPSRMATSRLRYRRLRDLFRSSDSREIMKIGPSTGTMLAVLNEKGHHAIGCDVSTRFVKYAKQEYGVRIDHGRFEELPYEDESFDVILMFNVIENIPNIDEFLSSVHRRLKPDGHFVINYVPMERNLIERIQGENYFMYRPPICYMFETKVLYRLLKKEGLAPIRRLADVRYMTPEKILSLLDWMALLKFARLLGVETIPFPIPAYPSKILVATRRPSNP